jgi:hypothetical protein
VVEVEGGGRPARPDGAQRRGQTSTGVGVRRRRRPHHRPAGRPEQAVSETSSGSLAGISQGQQWSTSCTVCVARAVMGMHMDALRCTDSGLP